MFEVETDDLKLIGSGGIAKVYQYTDDRIIKLYPSNMLMEDIIREEKAARTAFDKGISTARPYGIVSSKDGNGIVFEWVKGVLLSDLLMEKPDELDAYAPKFGRLLRSLHSTEFPVGELLSTKKIYSGYLERLSDWYSAKEIELMQDYLDRIPDCNTMVHSDFHTKNIIIRDGQAVLIDMAEVSLGHPIFDLSAIYDLFVCLAKRSPDSVYRFIGLNTDLSVKMWNSMIRVYTDSENDKLISKLEQLCYGFGLFRISLSPAIYVNMSDGVKKGRVERGRAEFLSHIDEHIKQLYELEVFA